MTRFSILFCKTITCTYYLPHLCPVIHHVLLLCSSRVSFVFLSGLWCCFCSCLSEFQIFVFYFLNQRTSFCCFANSQRQLQSPCSSKDLNGLATAAQMIMSYKQTLTIRRHSCSLVNQSRITSTRITSAINCKIVILKSLFGFYFLN